MNRITPSISSGPTVYSGPQSSTELTAFLKTVECLGFLRGAGAMTRKFFTESLILAQDERWRRA